MPDDDLLRRLRRAVESGTGIDAGELVDAAFQDAVAEARTVLQAVMTKALLEQAAEHLTQQTAGQSTGPLPLSRTAAHEPAAEADVATEGQSDPEGWVWYVYGVARAGSAVPTTTGVGGHEVVPIPVGRLQAIASRVPAADFSEAALERDVTDLEWLSREAQAHESVLAEAVSGRGVLPFRFGTVYRSRERIAELLTEHAVAFNGQLDRLSGRHEWSVKILVDDTVMSRWAAAHEPDVAALDADVGNASDGHSYFARKRQEQALDHALERMQSGIAKECHDTISQAAEQATTARPQDPSLSGYEGRMILNGIYLVDDTAPPGFRQEVATLEERHRARGCEFVVTGPWPPHSFVDIGVLEEPRSESGRSVR